MPDFSTSNVAATVGQNQTNPLQTVGNLLQIKQAQNALQLFPQQQQQLALQNTGLGITNQTDTQSLVNTQIGNLRNVIQSVAGKQNAQARDFLSAVQQGANAGLYSQDQANAYAGGAIQSEDLPSWQSLARQAALSTGSTAAEGALFGNQAVVSTGGGSQVINQNVVANTAAPVPGGYIPNTEGPEQQGRMISYQGASGQAKEIATSAVQDIHGHGIPNVKDGDGQQLTDSTGALTTTLAPNDLALINSTAQNQADRATSLETAFEGSAQRKALTQELLETNGEFRSGPGAAKWSGIVTEANRVLGTNFAADPAQAQQVFGKIAQMLASQQRDTLGLPATNAGQAAADIASPNSVYSPGANQAVVGQLAGNEDLLQKKEAAWTAYHKAGGTYNGFVRQFNKTYDPRYFWDQYVPPAQQAATGMSPAQATAYNAAKQRAMSLNF